ncbi:sushi, von Willebrand factor type A, EGF and pentraxin domain-containing protein 1-like [Ylistrum balloti]|uniref:sushi, von Willebrand factor type A, EGF and pentraxin domain-containing protein 1-like n=1 Tax=Ylistrum balloti TaxID=509963 RepID=UPI002905CF2A|nr:sushi, von Willebrand factor type A, EGF and pentraxin domain-containing protein 1-like [Ylistrum balloti]
MSLKTSVLIFSMLALTRGIQLDVPRFQPNFYLSSTGFKSISEVGLYDCARHCGLESGCKSFTYNTPDLRCRLIEDDSSTAPGQFQAKSRSIYGNRANVSPDETLMGTCRNHTCPEFSTCVRLTSTSTTWVCVVTACGSPPYDPKDLGADDVSTTMTPVGVTRSLTCPTGYIGQRTAVCLASGQWSDPKNYCTDCGNPPGVSSASVSSGSKTIGSSRTYQCNAGTTANDSTAIHCRSNGKWSTPDFVCIPECSIITNMQDAHTSATIAPGGSTIQYICDTGYNQMSGTGNRHCNADGTWGQLDISCDPVSCGYPPTPARVSGMVYSQFTYPNTVTFYCHSNTASSNPGNMQITCQSNGIWSAAQFECVPL